MKSIKLTALMFVVLLFSVNINAQSNKSQNWCSTDQHAVEMRKQDPSLIQKQQELEDYILEFKKTYNPIDPTAKKATIIIPVVVHNITHDGGVGSVTKAAIEGQLVTLNEDYNRLNGDAVNTRPLFAPYAGAIDIEFRLAHLDPNGNCTEGIVRAESPYSLSTSTNMAENVKSVSYWSSQNYFNIWVIDEIENNGTTYVAGYAQFPGNNNNGTYGVVVADQNFGPGYRVLTHELGHCLNLLHTFNYGNCNGGGDQCSDTPPVIEQSFDCDPNRNTCSNDGPFYGGDVVDQFENYMSYANCQNMYSLQQETRVMSILNNTNTSNGLAHLSTSANLAATGTGNPYGPVTCAPIADFLYDKEFVCEGGSVTFTDDSYNAIPTAWNWTFIGGTPSSSTVANPTITYNTSGVYSVTHQPSTSAGAGSITKNSIITVSSLTANYIGPISDGFENTTQFNNDWIIGSGTDAYDWQNTTNAAATGSRSIKVDNYSVVSSASDVDYIISPSYDLSASANKTVKFKVAFAKKASSNTDRLMVYYSLDCGGTWNLKLPLTTSNLVTAPDHTNLFIPTASEWVEKTIDFTAIGSSTNIRFKFQFESGGGNNIYLDDINIGGANGIEDLMNSIGSMNVYPNPTNSSAHISFQLKQNIKNLSIIVRNTLGQEVAKIINGQSFNSGKYTLEIDKEGKLSSGVYLIEFNADNIIKTQKLIIQ
jgi:PKD repeat protein